MPKPRVLVSVPTGDAWIHKHVSMATDALLLDPRYDVKIMRATHKPYENNLHHILNDFMAGPWDWWLNIDDDNPPRRNPLDLIELDKDVIGCPTPVWHTNEKGERPIYLNAYRKVKNGWKEWQPQEGLQKVDAVGTGCVLFARRVFEQFEMRLGPFQRIHRDDGVVMVGNDLAFGDRARENGFEVWAHFDYQCRHFVELELGEVYQAFAPLMREQK